jgi:hypothetical protein
MTSIAEPFQAAAVQRAARTATSTTEEDQRLHFGWAAVSTFAFAGFIAVTFLISAVFVFALALAAFVTN